MSWCRRLSSSSHDDDEIDTNVNVHDDDVDGEEGGRIGSLQSENSKLRDTIRQLEEENETLKKRARRGMVGLEQFEGERFFSASSTFPDEMETLGGIYRRSDGFLGDDDRIQENDLWCDELSQGKFSLYFHIYETAMQCVVGSLFHDILPKQFPFLVPREKKDECPVEPTISFSQALRDRAYWLVGLLLMQSFSGIILSRNEALLSNHPAIIFFLTMLVGAGGNAGNQASVRGMCGN